ncbi:tetratricopeptide repeat protein [Pedobacter sp. G11]|uniref:tetratricopeptide repeat protein n=1 Tax=Pedobacter sp. G11 TaxID=2482728 RepID=UPI000F5D6B01|nr:tetratricopeptide repeat protein [Pedobacter sp. G11]AZI24832.1 tetratricopeptide repeat protein [Pedobacter sp. G11]
MNVKLVTLMIIIGACIQNLSFAQSKSQYELHADSLLKIGALDKIIPYLNKELKQNPKSESLLRLLGFYHLQNNNLVEGEKYYRNALLINAKCARCYLNIARIYGAKNNEKEATAYIDKAVMTDPKDALIISNRGKLKEQFGDKFGALADHNKAIEMEPGSAEYYTSRGAYNANNGYENLAITDFNKAISLSPEAYDAYFYRGGVFYSQNRTDEALNDINSAISLNDKQAYFYNGRGAIYGNLGQFDKALADYTQSIKLDARAISAYLNRAKVYYELENLDAACNDYQRARQILIGQKLNDSAELKTIDEAIADFCDESKPSFYYQRGIAFYNLKAFDKALIQYEKGLEKFPKNAMILSFKGNAYLALMNYKNAFENYSAALENKESIMAEIKKNSRFVNASEADILSYYNSSLASIYFGIAECQHYSEDFENALTSINKAILLAPNLKELNIETYYNRRGLIYLATQKNNLALNDFNKSIQIKQDYAIAYVNRAVARMSMVDGGKQSASRLSIKSPNLPANVGWVFDQKSSIKKSENEFLAALADCNKAVELDKNLAYSYYVRGWIKQILGQKDYCIDILTAKKMGLEIDDRMLKSCNQ